MTTRFAVYIDRTSIREQLNDSSFYVKYEDLEVLPKVFFESLGKFLPDFVNQNSINDYGTLINKGMYLYLPKIGYKYASSQEDSRIKSKIQKNNRDLHEFYKENIGSVESVFIEEVLMKVFDNNKISVKEEKTQMTADMISGCISDFFDIVFIVSDDDEFISTVLELRNSEFGVPVYHVGSINGNLRSSCFGNIPLEKDGNFQKLLNI